MLNIRTKQSLGMNFRIFTNLLELINSHDTTLTSAIDIREYFI